MVIFFNKKKGNFNCRSTDIYQRWFEENVERNYQNFLEGLIQGNIEEFAKKLEGFIKASAGRKSLSLEKDFHNFLLGLVAGLTSNYAIYSDNVESGTGKPDLIFAPKDKKIGHRGVLLELKRASIHEEDKRGNKAKQFKVVGFV